MMVFSSDLFRALVSLCLVLSLSACGGGGGGGSTSFTSDGSGSDTAPPPGASGSSLADQTVTFADPGPVDLVMGSVYANSASGFGSGAITYSSSDTSVVTVSNGGYIATVGAGSAQITATKAADSQFKQGAAVYSVNVALAPQTIVLGDAGPFVVVSGTSLFNSATSPGSGAATYHSDNVNVATVDSSGYVNAVGIGVASITVTKAADDYYAAASASYEVDVTGPPLTAQTINFADPGPVVLSAGDSMSNPATGPGSGATAYSSSDPAVATVDAGGLVIATGFGTAQITANKDADSQFAATSASYTVDVNSIHMAAWVGSSDTEVKLPAAATGYSLYRTSDAACVLANYTSCANGQLTVVADGSTIVDSAATLNRAAYYTLKNQNRQTTVTVSTGYIDHTGYQTAVFNGQIWAVGGLDGTVSISGYKSDVWSSSDGFTWVLRNADAGFSGRAGHRLVVFNSKLWLIGGNYNNDVWSSVDGVTWVQETAHAAFSGRSSPEVAVFDNKLWLIGGEISGHYLLNDVWSSVDGINWVQENASAAFTARWGEQLAVFNSKLWLIGGCDGSSGNIQENDIWSSGDGVNWVEENPSAAFNPRCGHKVTTYNGRLWLVGGAGYSTPYGQNDVWSSSDGVSWTQEIASAAFNPRNGFGLVNFNNQLRVFGGCATFPLCVRQDDSWVSDDGRLWSSQSTNAAFTGRQDARVVVFNNRLWLFGGMKYDGGSLSDAWSSDDGIVWAQQTPMPFALRRDDESVAVFNDKLWYIAGQDNYGGSGNNDIWVSEDGDTWTRKILHAAFPARYGQQVVVFKGQLWLIAGNTYSSDLNDVWSSSDGVTWTQQAANAAFPARHDHQVVVYNDKLWLVGGIVNGKSQNDVWSSSDGVNWTKETASAPFSARSGYQLVVYENRMWLIGGSINNDVWSSTDGVSWTQQTAHAAFAARSGHQVLVYNGQLLLIGGYGDGTYKNDVWSSVDGIDWRQGFQRILQPQ